MLSVRTASGSNSGQVAMHLPRALADRAVDLADHHGGAVAEQNLAGPQPVGTEVDEATHRALVAHRAGDGQFVEAVLCRQHEAVRRQVRAASMRQRRIGRVRLHRQHDGRVDTAQLGRRGARTTWVNCSTGPLIFRPLLRQACTCASTMSTINTGSPARAQ